MAFKITDRGIGYRPIDDHSTTQGHPLGTIVKAVDPTYGEGEFIYLLGVASTVVGLIVSYDPSTHATTHVPSTANLAKPLAVAMAATVALEYGWYQICGVAVVKKTAVKVDPASTRRVYISGTDGRLMQTSAAGKCILGAASANVATVTSTTSTVLVSLNRPTAQGPIT